MPEFVIKLKLHKPDIVQRSSSGGDIFKYADFWQRKGFKIQIKSELGKETDKECIKNLTKCENDLYADDKKDEEEEPIRADQIDFVAQDYYLSGVKVE